MTGIHIRAARRDERQALEDLQRRSSLALPRYRAQLLAHPEVITLPQEQVDAGRVHVAQRDGVILGFSVVLPAGGEGAELDGLFVEPAFWRQGIGRRLVQAAENMARSEEAQAIWVIANPDAVDFYTACGFVQAGKVQTRFDSAPRMIKPLAKPHE